MIRLRGHHLLCLLGYRGMGYSQEYVKNMTRIHSKLRTTASTEILLVSGSDDLCEEYPESEPCHCDDENIHQRDAEVMKRLHLHTGQIVRWSDMEKRIARVIVAEDIATICSTCSWRSYGICAEGVADIRNGDGLRMIE